MMVEIFKTNVKNKATASRIIQALAVQIPTAEINFDLQDCDKILRIKDFEICTQTIINTIIKLGFECNQID